MDSRRKELLANVVAWALALCAFASTIIVVRREIVAKAQTRPRASIERDWKRFASGQVLRDSNADNTIVVFSDFQCPYCKRFIDQVDSLRARGVPIRVVFRHAPSPAHPHALAAARASECAAAQNAFEAMHDALFANADSVGIAPWNFYAQLAGVPRPQEFESCMSGEKAMPSLSVDSVDARRLGVLGTPTLLIGHIRHDGVPTLDSLRAYVVRAKSP